MSRPGTAPLPVTPADDAERFLATDQTVWFGEVSSAPAEQQLLGLPPEHRFAVDLGEDPSGYAGVYGVYPTSLTVPSVEEQRRTLPCAGLTWVGVHPDHRRRGVLTAMVRHHLEQVHEEVGTCLSALHASEPAIYARYGYGSASQEQEVSLGRGVPLSAPHLDDAAAATVTRLGSASDPGVPERLAACHRESAEIGTVLFETDYYRRVCLELPEQRRGKEPLRVLFAEREGADTGFAVFRRVSKWEHGRPAGELTVWSLVGDPASRLALLRRLLEFDLVASVTIRATGMEDPVTAWAGGPRAVSRLTTSDSLWVRLVDLAESLQGRGWSAPCDVVVEVADPSAPWNDGSWRIHVGADGEATAERTTTDADVRLPVSALGAAYLGGANLLAMLTAGLIAEQRTGAVAELWRAMRTDVLPTAAWMF